MVHHKEPRKRHQTATIYAGRNRFVKVKSYYPTRDTEMTTLDVAGFDTGWGDGEQCDLRYTGACVVSPETMKELKNVHSDDDVLFIAIILASDLPKQDGFWQSKPAA